MKFKLSMFTKVLSYLTTKRITSRQISKYSMKNTVSISYCIPVWNEHVELDRLLKTIIPFVDGGDEIIVQGDKGKVTDAVFDVVKSFPTVRYIEYPLNGNFAEYKNNFGKYCKGDVIFLIDADEIPSKSLLTTLKYILLENPEIDAFDVPRFNVVRGLTSEWIAKWRWNIQTKKVDKLDYDTRTVLELEQDSVQLVNLPDYQRRIYRRSETIKWQGSVHETLTGMNQLAKLPFDDFMYGLFHIKELDRQIRQNDYYETIC